ncbi:MAG: hypothetical protein VW547_03435 [Alphaproteobacteria bacterium]|jgi:hypothetical protein
MQNVWYILIHVSLGLIGWQVFTFTNIGVLTAMAACAGVQAWPMYELYRVTWPRFEEMRSRQTGEEARRRETRGYLIRMGRLYLFRTCAYSILTIFVAWLMRTG